MEGKNNDLQRLNQFKHMMLDSLTKEQKENHPLDEKLLQSIVLVHTLNDSYGLRALNENDESVEFDSNWAKGKQSIYKLRYQLKINDKVETVLFRFIDENGELNVNFCIQGSSDLQSYTIKATDNLKDIKDKHLNSLNKILPFKQNVGQQNQPILRPVPLMRPIQREPPSRPMPFNRPPDNLPFNNPFGKQEYIGPNSGIFGNGRNPGFQGPDPRGRYDPVDPFDYQGRVDQPDDFQGFDEFGNPILKPKIPPGPFMPGGKNPFNQQPPGFGGGFGSGFGSGFGGFGGGGFGPNKFF